MTSFGQEACDACLFEMYMTSSLYKYFICSVFSHFGILLLLHICSLTYGLQKGMLIFDAAQFDGILKKIMEFNNALLSDLVCSFKGQNFYSSFYIPNPYLFFFFSIRCCSLLFILRIMFTILFPHSNLSFDGFSFLLMRPSLIKVNLNRLLMHDSDFMVIS